MRVEDARDKLFTLVTLVSGNLAMDFLNKFSKSGNFLVLLKVMELTNCVLFYLQVADVLVKSKLPSSNFL